MKIRQLNIINFSGTQNRVVELDDGFNIIEGKNESGKTTICSFIKFMFYGFSDKAERNRLYSWGSKSACGTMTVSDERGNFRIEREYSEMSGDKVAIIDLARGMPIHNAPSPAEMFLGVPLKVFNATAFIGQTGGSGGDDMRLGGAIENIIFSADESVSTEKALKRLDDERVRLYYKNRRGGKIYDLLNERDQLRIRLERAKAANSELIEKEGTLREYVMEYEENKKHLAEVNDRMEYYEAAKKYRSLTGYRELAEKASDAKKQLEELNSGDKEQSFIPDESYVAELEMLDKDTDALEIEALKLREKLDSHNAKSAELAPTANFVTNVSALGGEDIINKKLNSLDVKRKVGLALGIVGIGVSLLLCGLAVFMYMFNKPINFQRNLDMSHKLFIVICGGLGILFFIISVLILIIRMRQKIVENEILVDLDVDSRLDLAGKMTTVAFSETKLSIHRAEGEDLTNRLSATESKINESRSRITELASKMGCDNARDAVAAAKYAISRKNELNTEIEKYSLARDMVGSPVDDDEEERLLEILAGRPYSEDVFNDAETENAKKIYDYYTASNAELSGKIAGLEKELAVLYATVEPPTSLADKLLCLERDIEEMSKSHKAYYLAHERLMAASDDLRGSITPHLSGRASELMSDLTRKRYTGIGVGSDLDMEYTAADGINRSIDFMSSGTQDVAYVSLRFALMELLYRGKKPPMIFDESFSRLDDDRLASMLELISRTVSMGSQVILFTSQRRDAIETQQNGVGFRHTLLR